MTTRWLRRRASGKSGILGCDGMPQVLILLQFELVAVIKVVTAWQQDSEHVRDLHFHSLQLPSRAAEKHIVLILGQATVQNASASNCFIYTQFLRRNQTRLWAVHHSLE